MNETLVCPADGELEHLLLEANDSGAPEIVAHLEQCEACQRRIEQIASRGVTWSSIANRLRAGQAAAGSRPAALDEAMRRLKQQKHWGHDDELPTSPDLPPGLLAPAKQPGQLGCLADYEVLEEVGRGAMGIVLRAFDPNLHRIVAIKVMSPTLAAFALARQRFVREGHSVAAVCHENVVAVHAVGEAAGVPYLVMQYVAGKTLQERIDQTGPMSVEDILRIGMQAAAGLAAAHAQGLVHRDIKPANLLLENGVERVKLTDFGLARAVDDASITQTGVISGTPQYMSPEQAQGEPIDARSDLFSLGCVLYAICTGRPPFRGSSTPAVLKRICEQTPAPIRERNPNIPDWLAGIVMKLLAKRPTDRFGSARELSELLGQCLEHWRQPNRIALPVAAVMLAQDAVVQAEDSQPRRSNLDQYAWLKTPLGVLLLIAALLFPLSRFNKWMDHWFGPRPQPFVAPVTKEVPLPAPDSKGTTTDSQAGGNDWIKGTWKLESLVSNGLAAPDEIVAATRLRFYEETVEFLPGEPGFTQFRYRLNPTTNPPQIDLTHLDGEEAGKRQRTRILGIYSRGDGVLRICLGDGGVRPTSFGTAEQPKHALYVLSRDRETTSSGEREDECP